MKTNEFIRSKFANAITDKTPSTQAKIYLRKGKKLKQQLLTTKYGSVGSFVNMFKAALKEQD